MICDSTPIIFLSKINKLELFKELFTSIIIPESVKEETLIENKPGYEAIKKAIEEKWIKIANPKKRLELNLGKGETDAISLAKEKSETLIIDDAYAIKAAKVYDINTIRTTTIIFMALKRKIINSEEAIKLLNKLIEEGYYIKPAEYAAILNKLQGLVKL